jgi:TPR repeat protein
MQPVRKVVVKASEVPGVSETGEFVEEVAGIPLSVERMAAFGERALAAQERRIASDLEKNFQRDLAFKRMRHRVDTEDRIAALEAQLDAKDAEFAQLLDAKDAEFAQLCQLAASHGLARAQLLLGNLHREGRGVAKDDELDLIRNKMVY